MPRRHRVGRALVSLFGYLLTLAGLLAAVPVGMFVLALLLGPFIDADIGEFVADAGPVILAFALAAMVLLFLGLRLVRGRRRLVLFLRRFGFDGASRALTFAVGTALGRRWRLVTLDDAEIAPVGVSKGAARTFRLGRWVGLAVFLVAAVLAVVWITGGAPGRIVEEIFQGYVDQATARGENIFAVIVGAIVVTIAVGAVALGLIFGFIFLGVASLGTATLFTWSSWRAVRKAERSKMAEVRSAEDVETVISRLSGRARRIFAPRLAVLRVAHRIWRQVVKKLVGAADLVIVDVSEPTENLLWEVDVLKDRQDARRLFVGLHERVERLARSGYRATDADPVASRLRALLEGEEVLVYRSEERDAMREFAVALAAQLAAPTRHD